jgi:gluconate 2-dehydrogenase gamma chain
MDDPYAVDRRDFLKTTTVAAAATSVACGAPQGRWRVLTDAEATTLEAACDQIIPPDDAPGASQAGVVAFIDRQLATREKDQLATWQRGVRGLNAAATGRSGLAFAELPFEKQTRLLQDLEAGQIPAAGWEGLDPRAFFDRLVRYTMMGFYGDPRHGGNRDRVSWRMLGLPDPPIRGRLHETPVGPSPDSDKGR